MSAEYPGHNPRMAGTDVWPRALRLRGVLFVLAACCAVPGHAEFTVFDQDGRKAVLNVDVIAAGFGSSNSWFGESESFLGDDTSDWFEFGIEPRLSLEMPLGRGTAFGQVSGVFTNTAGEDASGLTIGSNGDDELDIEQGHVGYKLENPFAGLDGDTFTISVGRQDYTIGTGLLVADGGADGGEHGGWYVGLRKAHQESVIAKLETKDFLVEGFRIKNRPRRGGVQGQAYGGNFEYTFAFAGDTRLGATYMSVDAELPASDVLNVWSGRLDWTHPTGFGLAGEYVHQTSSQIEADGWFAQTSYQAARLAWKPTLSYRYARFDGDDPTTGKDERFREVAYGYTDYGNWFQGEITGNYPLGNNNLISHLVRLKSQPTDSITLNILYYDFSLDEPAALDPAVISDDWGDELNFIVDWAASKEFYLIGVIGVLFPGDAARQWTGGNDDWVYGMGYAAWSW